MKVKPEHMDVLRTLYDNGSLTRQAMKSIRGQIISMKTDEEREAYLRKLIKRSAGRSNNKEHKMS